MAISDIIAALLNPSSQEGYDQGAAVANTNPRTAIAQALAAPTAQQGALSQLMGAGTGAPYGYGAQSAVPPQAQAPVAQAMSVAGNGASMGPPSSAAPQAPQAPQQDPTAPPMSTTGSSQLGFQPGQGAPDASPFSSLSPAMQAAFNNQSSNPNYSLGMGALAAAKGFGSAPMGNVAQSIGNAAGNFGEAYNSALTQQQSLNTPKVTPLSDGAFSMVQMPGQQPQVVANGQVQDFVRSKMAAQFGYDMAKQDRAKSDQIAVQSAGIDAKQGVAAQQNLQTLTQSAQGLQQVQQLNEQLKADPARLTALQVYAKLPPAAQRLAVMSGNQASIQAQSDLQVRSNAAIDGSKIELTGLNGGSDDALKKASSAVPPADADPANWDQYLSRTTPLIQERVGFYNDVVNRGQGAGNRTINGASANTGRPVVPNTLGGQGGSSIPRVTDAASYNAIPPGGYYMTPQGQYKQKGTQ